MVLSAIYPGGDRLGWLCGHTNELEQAQAVKTIIAFML
jgi:hypothetical protein